MLPSGILDYFTGTGVIVCWAYTLCFQALNIWTSQVHNYREKALSDKIPNLFITCPLRSLRGTFMLFLAGFVTYDLQH